MTVVSSIPGYPSSLSGLLWVSLTVSPFTDPSHTSCGNQHRIKILAMVLYIFCTLKVTRFNFKGLGLDSNQFFSLTLDSRQGLGVKNKKM